MPTFQTDRPAARLSDSHRCGVRIDVLDFMKLYKIRDWAIHFENNRTREMKNMSWIPVPNKHDGDGYTTLVSRENGAALLGAWLVILQVASRCEIRGTLLRSGKTPHDSRSLARITRLPMEIISEALKVCSTELDWIEIEVLMEIPQDGAEIPQDGAASRARAEGTEGKGTEGKGTEGKGTEGKGTEGKPSPEILTKKEAFQKTANAGIPKDFSNYIFDDWFSREGKDAGGVPVDFLRYVVKRWSREQNEWKSGQHNGNKKPSNGTHQPRETLGNRNL